MARLQEIIASVAMLISILATPVQAAHAVVAIGASPLSTAFSSQRKVVKDSAGNLYVVYLKQAGNLSLVYLAASQDGGRSWTDVGRVSEGDYQSVRASVAIDRANRLHIFWTEFLGEYGQIFYRTYRAGTWSGEYQITQGDAYSGYPSAAFDSNGLLHLVWYGFDGQAYQVFYTKLQGGQWTAPTKLSQGYPDSVNPTITVDSRNDLHVAWYKSDGRHYQINYMKWSAGWGKQVIISTGTETEDAFNPTMAVDQNDVVYIAWDQGQGPRTRIFYARSVNVAWSTPEPITSADPAAENPSAGVDPLGRFFVLYDKSDGQVYLRRLEGGDWSSEIQLSNNGVNSYPSARWAYVNVSPTSPDKAVDYVWTSRLDGETSVFYGGFEVASPLQGKVYNPSIGEWLELLAIMAAAAALLIVYLRRFPMFTRGR